MNGIAGNLHQYDSSIECLDEEAVADYRALVIGDVIYRVENEELDPYGFEKAVRNPDGSIDYTILFYNGGAWWGEVITNAVENLDEPT